MRPIVITVAFVLLACCGTVLWAQEAAQIRASVKDGPTVVVTDDQGRELARDDRCDVRFADIVRIDRPPGTLANGALTGLGVGAALGPTGLALEDARECDPGAWFDCSDPSLAGYVIAP